MVNLQMKKIVIAIFTLQGNGAERFALTLAKGLVDAGHEAHIIYFKNIIDLPIPEGVKLHFLIIKSIGRFPNLCVPVLQQKLLIDL